MATPGERVLRFTSSGFDLCLPPTPFNFRFFMLDESSSVFYDVDCASLRTPNDPSWNAVAPERFTDPAIVFPPDQAPKLGPRSITTGFLVSVTRRENGEIWARSCGQVMVKPLPPMIMSWDGLVEKKGPVLLGELRAGLMGRLWNRRPGARVAHTYVTPRDVLDRMPRKWHTDGVALSNELDYIFSAGRRIPPSHWCLHE